MRADNSRHLTTAARQRAEQTRARAVRALRRLDETGKSITFEAVAAEAGVSRSWLYSQQDIRAEIQALRTRQQPSPAAPLTPSDSEPPRHPCCAGSKRRPSGCATSRKTTANCDRPSGTFPD